MARTFLGCRLTASGNRGSESPVSQGLELLNRMVLGASVMPRTMNNNERSHAIVVPLSNMLPSAAAHDIPMGVEPALTLAHTVDDAVWSTSY